MSYPERTEVRSRLYSEIQQLGFLLAFLHIHRPINCNFPQKTYNANFWDSKTGQDVKIDKNCEKCEKFILKQLKNALYNIQLPRSMCYQYCKVGKTLPSSTPLNSIMYLWCYQNSKTKNSAN